MSVRCEGQWCFRPAEVMCRCGNVRLCRECGKVHVQQGGDQPHRIVEIGEDRTYQGPRVTYGKVLYRTPEGSTEIYEGRVEGYREKVALKVQYCKDKKEVSERQEEAALQRSIRHPNICRCLTSFLDPTYSGGYKHVIVMEYGEMGDLQQEIERRRNIRKKMPEGELMDTMFAVSDALAYLQSVNIVHRDVKPCNILLCPSPKLADFGLTLQGSSQLRTQSYQVVGTVIYLSPALKQAYLDMWEGRNTTGEVKHNPFKSDVFSLGLTFLALAMLEIPSGLNSLSQGIDELRIKIQQKIAKIRYSSKIKQVISVMLEPQEELRPDFVQLMEMMKRLEFTCECEGSEVENASVEDSPTSSIPSPIPQLDFDFSHFKSPKLPSNLSLEVSSMVHRSIRMGEKVSSMRVSKRLEGEEVKAICWVLGKSRDDVREVELDGAELGDEGVKQMASSLSVCSHLTTLSLGHNCLTTQGLKSLSPLFPSFPHLQILRLWRNPLSWEGAVHLSLSLAHCLSLQELYLGETQLGSEGVRFLSQALVKLVCLKIGSFTDNDITSEGLNHLCPALLQTNSIQRLYLDGNSLDSQGVERIIALIRQGKGLIVLSIGRNRLNPEDLERIRGAAGRVKLTF